MKKIYLLSSIVFFLTALIYAFFSYFIFSIYLNTGYLYDGFGRKLYATPDFVRFIIDQGYWRGAWWHLFDLVLFFGGLYLAYVLFMKYCDFPNE